MHVLYREMFECFLDACVLPQLLARASLSPQPVFQERFSCLGAQDDGRPASCLSAPNGYATEQCTAQ
jgi:hypothetical protein